MLLPGIPSSSCCECRPKTLEEACLQYVCPFCHGTADKHAEQKAAEIYSTLYALAEALKVDIMAQPAIGAAIDVRGLYEQRSSTEWQMQIGLICKPGHFTVAWA